jgi:hypothetical protein
LEFVFFHKVILPKFQTPFLICFYFLTTAEVKSIYTHVTIRKIKYKVTFMNFKYLFATSMFFITLNADVLTDMVDRSKEIYRGVKDKSVVLYQDITKEESDEEKRTRHFQEIWNKVRVKLIRGTQLYSKKENAPKSTIILGDDKGDIQEDIDELLNDTIALLLNDDLLAYQEEIAKLNKKIDNNELKLAEYKEERVGAPIKSMVHTTKEGYDKKIKNTKDEIGILKNKIHTIEQHLKERFALIGVTLSVEQIEVLLARADGHDIVQVSLVIDVIKQITEQILDLMKESKEDLIQAKRYYGMHLVSLALVVHLQQQYIDRVNRVYIPKIDTIVNKANSMIERTEILIDKERNEDRKRVYLANLEAQQFTQKVAIKYKEELIVSREKMKKAQEHTQQNLLLAENTFATVSLSSGLYNLIAQSQMMFNKISRIQIPQIVPFENIQIEQKYRELTKQILRD